MSKTKEEQEKIEIFKEVMRDLDKHSIADVFETGLEVGFFGEHAEINNVLTMQFIDDKKKYVYLLRRQPIKIPSLPISGIAPLNDKINNIMHERQKRLRDQLSKKY